MGGKTTPYDLAAGDFNQQSDVTPRNQAESPTHSISADMRPSEPIIMDTTYEISLPATQERVNISMLTPTQEPTSAQFVAPEESDEEEEQ